MKVTGWSEALFLIISFLFAKTNGDYSTGAIQSVRCMLSQSQKDCASLPKVRVPSYLLQEYLDSPTPFQQALWNKHVAQLSEEQVANIPLSLLYLMPRSKLADLNANQLRAILQKYAHDSSLAHQVAASLHGGNKIKQLFEKMNHTYPQESLQILAESVEDSDLTDDFLKLNYLEEVPLLAYLRPAVLFKVDASTLNNIFLLLQRMESSNPPKKSAFYFLTEAAVRHKYSLSKLKGFVLGSSPDQLVNEGLLYDNAAASSRLDLSLLQARALFERFYLHSSLSSSNFIDSKPLLFKLSPELLQKISRNFQKYEIGINEKSSVPLPTACQITDYVRATCVMTGRLPKDEYESWGIQIRHLGTWVYTLPLSSLEGYLSTVLSPAVLVALESPTLSPIQAYYLTGKGEALDVMTPNSVLELETFLHALPASQLVNRKIGEISSHVLLHLVSKLPADNLARTLSLVNKIASSIGDITDDTGSDADDIVGESSILEELLGNRDVNQIMALISPKDLELSADAIVKFFAEHGIRRIGPTIEQLPQHILAALLEHVRLKNSSNWRWSSFLDSSHVNHLLVGGLTCQHIDDMDTGMFVPIMAHYNAIRKKSFPKNLQNCCIEKLINLLKLKMTLTQTVPESGLISLLEPIEIESVGGYILVNLPIDALQVSPYLGHILSNIGRLSSAELMLSADISQLKQIAELAIDKEGNVNTFLVRNLVWFLPPSANTPDLRLMLEAQLVTTTICLPADARRAIATRLIEEFGPLQQWSAGVLAVLQDLLIVFTEEELGTISRVSWTKAADSFTSHYNDLVDWTEPSSFYKVCSSILGKFEDIEYKKAIGHYIRWRLRAAQWLLDTVVPTSQPEDKEVDYYYMPNQEEEEPKKTISVFDPDKETESTTVEANESEYVDSEYDEEKASTVNEEQTTIADNPAENTSTEKQTTESTVNEETTEESVARQDSSEKTTIYENITKHTETQHNKTQENTTTEKIFEEIRKNISNEVPINTTIIFGRTDKNETSVLNSTTQKPISINITSTYTENISTPQEKNITVKSEDLATDNKNLTYCSNLVNNKEECQNSTIPMSSSTEGNSSTKLSINKINNISSEMSRNKTASSGNKISQMSSKIPHILNETISFQSKNHSAYSTFQNATIAPSKLSLNQSEYQTSNISIGEFGTLQTTTVAENQNDKNSDMPSSSETEDNEIYSAESSNKYTVVFDKNKSLNMISLEKTENDETYSAESSKKSTVALDKNKTSNVISPEKIHTRGNNLQNNNISVMNDTKSHSSNEDLTTDGEEEDVSIDISALSDRDKIGILMDSKERHRRSILSIKPIDMELSCNAVKMVGSLAELALTEADLEGMSKTEVEDCRVEFGAMELSEALHKNIWKRITNDLKLAGIHLLGRLLQAANAADLWDIDFRVSEPWTLETIQALIRYNNKTVVMKKLMENIVKRNPELSVDLLAVLGSSVCSLETDTLRALSVVGLDLGPSCPSCLPYLAQRAIEELGSVGSWTLHFVHSLQAIVAGLDLDNWKKLASSYHKPLAGLQPSAAKCLNSSYLEALSPDQIRMIPSVTLLSFSDHQLAALNSTQLETIKKFTHPIVTDKMTPTTNEVYEAGFPIGNSNQVLPTTLLIAFICFLNFLLCL